MVLPVQIPLGSQYYKGRTSSVDSELVQNLYFERNPENAKAPSALIGTPGLELFATVGSGPIRGIIEMAGDLWVVSGTELYRVNPVGNSVLIAGAIKGTGPVRMVQNGTWVAIAAARFLYYANLDGAFTYVGDEFEYPNGAAFQDGYGIFTSRKDDFGRDTFWITGTDNNFNTIAALDFSNADVFPDRLMGCVSDHRELILFGEKSIEVWHNIGNNLFPFSRASAGFVERGCLASGSIAKADNHVLWEGDDRRVYAMSGNTPQRISTHAVERFIEERASPGTAEAFVYSQEGHTFYVLSFSDGTIVYDMSTGLWHTRVSTGENRWRVNHYARLNSKSIVGDFQNGNLYDMRLDRYTENGALIQRRVITPPLHLANSRIVADEVVLDVDTGPDNPYQKLSSIALVGTGTGYTAGDIITLSGGNFVTPVTIRVDLAIGILGVGYISQYTVLTDGLYSEVPVGTLASTTDGNGTGATWTVTWANIDPQVMLDWSDDGGRTYENEQWRSMGAAGEDNLQVSWYNLGAFRQRHMRFTITDPVSVVINACYARWEALMK